MATAYPQQPPRLTVQEALDLADKQNLDLAAARRRRAVALAGIGLPGKGPIPPPALALYVILHTKAFSLTSRWKSAASVDEGSIWPGRKAR